MSATKSGREMDSLRKLRGRRKDVEAIAGRKGYARG